MGRTGIRRARPVMAGYLWLVLLALGGCAGDPDSGAPGASAAEPASGLRGELADAPAWVRQGCEVSIGGGGELVCGVGSMSGAENTTRARSTAITRARSEIARSLETKVAAMLKDYATSSGTSARGRASQADIVDVSRQITRVSLTGSVVRETWSSPSGNVFALVVLDLDDWCRAADAEPDPAARELSALVCPEKR